MRELRAKIPADLEIEAFVHGAMCVAYSGRCLLSAYMTGRDANRGECAYPCRWNYSLVEDKRPGESFPVYEDERGTHIMSSKDLNMIEHVGALIEAGIDSFKVEGRLKNALYAATIARAYRHAIDDYFESPAKFAENLDWYREQVAGSGNRDYTTGFYFGKPSADAHTYFDSKVNQNYTFVGNAEPSAIEGWVRIEQRNKFWLGSTVEIMKADGRDVHATVLRIVDEHGEDQDSAPHPRQVVDVLLSEPAEPGDLLRTPL
jgi:putative protease